MNLLKIEICATTTTKEQQLFHLRTKKKYFAKSFVRSASKPAMKITITTLADYIFTLDVSEDLELENFKVFCEVESGFPAPEIVISFNGVLLKDEKKSLKDYGIVDGDMVVLQRIGGQTQGSRWPASQGAPSEFKLDL